MVDNAPQTLYQGCITNERTDAVNELHLFAALRMARVYTDMTTAQVMRRMTAAEEAGLFKDKVWGNMSEDELCRLLSDVGLHFFAREPDA